MRVARAGVQGLGEVCITLGLVLLLFVAWQLWWTDLAAGPVQRETATRLEQSWQRPVTGERADRGTRADAKDGPQGTAPAQVPMGAAFALIRVPAFGRDYVRPVLEGVELEVLDRGVGHYPDSVAPGQVGNFAVAGHRVTYAKPFNQIAELGPGDPVVVETRDTRYVYRVTGHTIVTPDRVDVVAPVPEHPGDTATRAMMTMTACHPMYSARERYVVYAQLRRTIPKVEGAVPDVLTG